MSYGKRWVFTVNNYTDEDVNTLKKVFTDELCVYAIVGKEKGEKNDTPHLQGFVHFRRKMRLGILKKTVSLTAHFEYARGSDEENQKYCSKDGNIVLEIGQPAAKIGTNKSYLIAKELADKIASGKSLQSLLDSDEKYVEAYAKHAGFVETCVRNKKDSDGFEAFTKEHGDDNLVMYKWQSQLYDLLTKTTPHPRKIYWYVDPIGGAGKSTFCNVFMARHKAVCFFGGRLNDLSYAYDREPVVFFDLARSGANEYLYGFMEQLKNGRIFSSKYQSGFKYFRRPHVVVFSNEEPPANAFSKDRLVVLIIKQNAILKCRYEMVRDRSPVS